MLCEEGKKIENNFPYANVDEGNVFIMIFRLKLPITLLECGSLECVLVSREYAKMRPYIYLFIYLFFLKVLMAKGYMRRGGGHVSFGGSWDGILVRYSPGPSLSPSCAAFRTSLAIPYSLTFSVIWIGIVCSVLRLLIRKSIK